MAIVALNSIKNWFRSGLVPTETQFWDTWDSFRHKNEKVPVADIEGISSLLGNKADKADFDHHLSDRQAHPELLESAKFIPVGQFTVWKHPSNNDPTKKSQLEINDLVMGWVGINWIHGFYLGGNLEKVESFDINIIL